MPGLAGVISQRSPEECHHLVGTMLASMSHNSSYITGTRYVPDLGFFGGWVAHKGSFAARLLVGLEHDDLALLFSGECFSDRLGGTASDCAEGIRSDGGALEKLYEQQDTGFVSGLNGTFSGALADRRRNRILLFNDRYGIERIYYYEKEGTTFFASEAKALLRILPELRNFDDEGVAQFLAYGCTLEGRTLFRGLRFMPGGSMWMFDEHSRSSKSQYFRPEQWSSQPELTEDDFETEYTETLRRVLPRYLGSDSRVGISLTGGLDTRMIMAGLASTDPKPVCYTFAGLTGRTLDVRLAAQVAEICGLEHHTLRIGEDFLQEFGRHLDRTVYVTDGCAGALTAHEIYLNALASRLSPVRVTGNFGSEILRGVSTFKPTQIASELINPEFGRLMAAASSGAKGDGLHPVAVAAFREIPWSLFGSLAAGRSQVTFRTPYLDNELVALAFRAPAKSRQSPQASLRMIFESSPVLASIPTDRGVLWGGRGPAYWLRRLFGEVTFKLDYLHKEGLPNWLLPFDPAIGALSEFGVLGLHKFLPYRTWFRRDLAGYVRGILNDPGIRGLPYWNAAVLPMMAEDHIRGRRNCMREIHAILTLEAVDRLFISGGGMHPMAATQN